MSGHRFKQEHFMNTAYGIIKLIMFCLPLFNTINSQKPTGATSRYEYGGGL